MLKVLNYFFRWLNYCEQNNLKMVTKYYCPKFKELEKETRNIFVEGTVEDIRSNLQKLVEYNFDDVHATALGNCSLFNYLNNYFLISYILFRAG